MRVTAKVSYPVHVDLEIADNLTEEEIEVVILNEAEKLLQTSTVKPNCTIIYKG